jgi:hypothetical protein
VDETPQLAHADRKLPTAARRELVGLTRPHRGYTVFIMHIATTHIHLYKELLRRTLTPSLPRYPRFGRVSPASESLRLRSSASGLVRHHTRELTYCPARVRRGFYSLALHHQ